MKNLSVKELVQLAIEKQKEQIPDPKDRWATDRHKTVLFGLRTALTCLKLWPKE